MIRRLIYVAIRVPLKIKEMFYIQYNKLLFWSNGVSYGRRMRVFNKVYIRGNGTVHVGDDFLFTSDDSLNPLCRNIRGAIYTMDRESKIEIGDRVGISSSCIWALNRVSIGNDVNIGGDCIIIDNDAHPHDFVRRRREYQKMIGWSEIYQSIPAAPIVIDNDVWIGARCQILKGVHIGARSIIAAGSVVTKDIPSDVMAGGNPCRIIRPLVEG